MHEIDYSMTIVHTANIPYYPILSYLTYLITLYLSL